MNPASSLTFLAAYARARRLDRWRGRGKLEQLQQRWLAKLTTFVSEHSPYYRRQAGKSWHQWPIIDKNIWMSHFDEINTVGARLDEIAAIAQRAEQSRDFSHGWGKYSVGLSTGTSGSRGLFLVSPRERALWSGTLLAKVLRNGLFGRERIALVLRAGAQLYESVGALCLTFRFFDQAQPWPELVNKLQSYDPTILVAPASALRLLANSADELRPRRVISVAEVLDDLDRSRIERRFGVRVDQIYQATEGLLGISCEQGQVHLNEPYMFVEPEWLDNQRTRFIPVVTDLWRRSQPVIRYRLNDVLRAARDPCACGRVTLALAAIDGRENDVLWLEGDNGQVPVFADLLSRAIVSAVPEVDDYEVVETQPVQWRIGLRPLPSKDMQDHVLAECSALFARLKARPPALVLAELVPRATGAKQRRIRRELPRCAS